MPATPMKRPQWRFWTSAIMSFDVVRFGSSLYPSFIPGLFPDTEIAVVTPDSPISAKNFSSVLAWNAAILPNIPDFCVCLRKYSESFSVVRRQRASMIIRLSESGRDDGDVLRGPTFDRFLGNVK
jgi:hypothetical protein